MNLEFVCNLELGIWDLNIFMVDVNLLPTEYKKRKRKLGMFFSKTKGIAIILLIVSLLLYGGLFLYQNKLNQDLDNIKKELAGLDRKRDPKMEKAIADLNKTLIALEELFKSHLYWSELFDKVEELTVPQVYFSEAKFNILEENISTFFSGNALTYTALAQQIASFQGERFVKKIEVSAISLSTEGGIDFDLAIIFSKDILLAM